MVTVYIAAPYSADTEHDIGVNVLRAEKLAAYAFAHGCAPVCIHRQIHNGVLGRDNVPEEREAGLKAAVAIAKKCDELWVLRKPDNSISIGCATEVRAFGRTPRYFRMDSDYNIEETG